MASSNKQRALVACLTWVTIACVTSAGCGPGEIGRPAYDLTVALDQAMERRDASQLDRAEELVESKFSAGEIASSERQLLLDIIAQGRGGDWDGARQDCRQVLSAQVDW